MYRICVNMNILAPESHCYDDEIVDVLEVVTNSFFCVLRTGIANNQIPCGANSNLISYVTWKDELAVVPTNFNLVSNKSILILTGNETCLLSSPGCIDHFASHSERRPSHVLPQGMIWLQLDRCFVDIGPKACRL